MPQVKKICVDSRFVNAISKSNTDFRVDLTDSLHLPENTAVIITDISIPHSWYSIEYYNENFYFRWVEDGFYYSENDYKIQLTHKNYDITSLAQELQSKMNAATGTTKFGVTANLTTAKLTVTITGANSKFYIFSDKDLLTQVNGTWNGPLYDGFQPHSCNGVVGFNTNYNYAAPYTSTNPWVSGVIDVLGIHNIYITSPQFGNNSFGPKGERNILKKVVVNAPFGGIITENWLNDQDYTDCSKQLLRTIDFRLTDSFGNALELNGGHVSFTLIFVYA